MTLPASLVPVLEEHVGQPVVVGSGLVFPSPDGGPLRRTNFRQRVWLRAVKRAGLAGFRFHDLRHTAAAFAIATGAHAKALQSRLGHSSVSVTLDRYGHLLPGLDEQIATGLDGAFREFLAGDARENDETTVLSLGAGEGSHTL